MVDAMLLNRLNRSCLGCRAWWTERLDEEVHQFFGVSKFQILHIDSRVQDGSREIGIPGMKSDSRRPILRC